MTDIVPNAWQAARIAQDFMDKLHDAGKTQADIDDGLPYVRGVVARLRGRSCQPEGRKRVSRAR